MTLLSFHTRLERDEVSSLEITVTTSSQIFLSRGVAPSGSESPPPPLRLDLDPTASIVSAFESNSRHIMTIGDTTDLQVKVESCRTPSSDLDLGDSEQNPLEFTPDPNIHFITTVNSNSDIAGSYLPERSSDHDMNNFASTEPTQSFDNTDSNFMRYLAKSTSWNLPPCSSSHTADERTAEGEEKQTERGRSVGREPRYVNPFARAESRNRGEAVMVEIDASPMSRSSTFFEDPSDPCAAFEDRMLEPCPHLPMCSSVSEVLSQDYHHAWVPESNFANAANSPITDLRYANTHPTNAPGGGLADSLARSFADKCKLLCKCAESSGRCMVCQHHANACYSVRPPTNSGRLKRKADNGKLFEVEQDVAAYLPNEIIQQIYWSLSPTDFNAARHICRSWYIGSLEKKLLECMLKRGGWWSGIRDKVMANHIVNERFTMSDEWLMSRRIARECALGSAWAGNGLKASSPPFSNNLFPGMTKEAEGREKTALTLTSKVDFTEIGVKYSFTDSIPSGSIFTVSVCQKFLMVASGCLVYIYGISQDVDDSSGSQTQTRSRHTRNAEALMGSSSFPLKPLTTLICPRRILACSMDTSSRRYAVAVLMDGRRGLVYDLTLGVEASKRHHSRSSGEERQAKSSQSAFKSYQTLPRPPSYSTLTPKNGYKRPRSASETTRDHPLSQSEGPNFFDPNDSSSRYALPTSTIPCMPIESSKPTIFCDLCSADDPPRSVAICPQRRCVAFGCSSGIELHWTDALTNQDLNRWFPLTSSSDFLYFLPPRRGIDSSRKLRLISSSSAPGSGAAGGLSHGFAQPGNNFDISRPSGRFADRGSGSLSTGSESTSDADAERRSYMSRFRRDGGVFGRTGLTYGIRSNNGRVSASDHYRAVPLSDGYHVLFTDPTTGTLCLGSDAPIGGPTKLLRKIWLRGPDADHDAHGFGSGFGDNYDAGGGYCRSPVAYASCSDLSQGVRIAAAYPSRGTGSSSCSSRSEAAGDNYSIWLFSVPPDVFADSHADRHISVTSPGRPAVAAAAAAANAQAGHAGAPGSSAWTARHSGWRSWWPPAAAPPPLPPPHASPNPQHHPTAGAAAAAAGLPPPSPLSLAAAAFWPITVRGQCIGSARSVTAVAVAAGPRDLAVWAFGRSGFAGEWTLAGGGSPRRSLCGGQQAAAARQAVAAKDGTLRGVDEEGDVWMMDREGEPQRRREGAKRLKLEDGARCPSAPGRGATGKSGAAGCGGAETSQVSGAGTLDGTTETGGKKREKSIPPAPATATASTAATTTTATTAKRERRRKRRRGAGMGPRTEQWWRTEVLLSAFSDGAEGDLLMEDLVGASDADDDDDDDGDDEVNIIAGGRSGEESDDESSADDDDDDEEEQGRVPLSTGAATTTTTTTTVGHATEARIRELTRRWRAGEMLFLTTYRGRLYLGSLSEWEGTGRFQGWRGGGAGNGGGGAAAAAGWGLGGVGIAAIGDGGRSTGLRADVIEELAGVTKVEIEIV